MNEVTAFDWLRLLQHWNETILADPEQQEDLSIDAVATGWLGNPGATAEQIQAVESRLGVRLPSSYASFLAVSNGWPILPPFIERIWSTEELAWFRERHQDWIDIYNQRQCVIPDSIYFIYGEGQGSGSFRPEYLHACLEISDEYDGAVILLNPLIVDARGEWEAWLFANWAAGALRYPSFMELMQALWEIYQQRRMAPEEPVDSGEQQRALSPLLWAAGQDSTVLVSYLLDRGDDIEDRGEEGESPLMVAARSGHPDIVRLLLDRGADPNYVTDNGWDVVQFAEMSGNPEVIAMVQQVYTGRTEEDDPED